MKLTETLSLSCYQNVHKLISPLESNSKSNATSKNDQNPSNTLYWADVGPIEFLVGNIGQLSRLSPDSQPTV
jgi:hypothetical protein